jgi:hypothetical protein
MLVVDLHCEHGHVFEGWFASAEELTSQQLRGLVICPVCGTAEVVRRPAASRLNVSSLRDKNEGKKQDDRESTAGLAASGAAPRSDTSGEQVPSSESLQALYLQAVRHVIQNTEDVGTGFVKEVRDMHRGDAPQRPVRGEADQQEVAELREEGIDVLSMQIPDALKGPVQ